MCRQSFCPNSLAEVVDSAEANLLLYCKPVELYNILHQRSLRNPLFLSRCLDYKIQDRRKRKLMTGMVIFNYKDFNNILQKTEVTEDFCCPFCLMLCASYKGLRFHLRSSHDLFEFEFWISEDYQAVNVSVKLDSLRFEAVEGGEEPRLQTFFLCSKPRKRSRKDDSLKAKQLNVQFLELDLPKIASENIQNGFPQTIRECSKSFPSKTEEKNGWHGTENCGPGYPDTTDLVGSITSNGNVTSIPVAMAQSTMDSEYVKSISISDAVLPAAKTRKLSAERSEARNYMLLQKRQFYHSHRVQPMALEQVMSDRDSEDEVDDDIADLEDHRMLDDFVDVSKDEKQFMHLWNSFVRKQRVIADGHVPWACEAFLKLHGKELMNSPTLFWCWRLFMIKLWNHGLIDASTMNNCNLILDDCREEDAIIGANGGDDE